MELRKEMSTNNEKNNTKLNRETSSETSSDELSSCQPQNKSQQETDELFRTTTDAIHPRFHSRSDLLFKCESCEITTAKEKKIHKHFFKYCKQLFDMPKYTCPLPECGGPSFVYKFKNETRIYHSCSRWAKLISKSPDMSISSLSSRVNSSTSFASSNMNGSNSTNSSMVVSNSGSTGISTVTENQTNGDRIISSSENDFTNGDHIANRGDFDIQ